MIDLVLAGGSIVDGSGRASFVGDVGIRGSRIETVGRVDESATRVVRIDGLTVTPGFIDPHVHYDAQVMWDPHLTPSSRYGVTSVVGGNCGFSVAPLAAKGEEYIVPMLAAVEGMDADALFRGTDWSWAGFGQWLDRLPGRLGVNAAFFVGHSTVRAAVLGAEATNRHATSGEIEKMAGLVSDALDVGAVGFSTSTNEAHLDGSGDPVPSRAASIDEFRTLAQVLKRHQHALIEIVPAMDAPMTEDDYEFLTSLSLAAAAPLILNSIGVDSSRRPYMESLLASIPFAAARGGRIIGLTIPDTSRLRLSFSNGMILQAFPGWSELFAMSPPDRIAALGTSVMREKLRQGLDACRQDGLYGRFADFGPMRIGESTGPRTIHNGRTVDALAAERGLDVVDLMADLAVEEELQVGFWPPVLGDDADSWRIRSELWQNPDILVGGGDAGAHLDAIDSFSYPATLVGPAVRDRGLLSLEQAVRLLTAVPASIFGLAGRGRIEAGAYADLAVFDPAVIAPGPLELRTDLPGGARRLYSEAMGLEHVLVNGTFIVQDSRPTLETPGRLLRRV